MLPSDDEDKPLEWPGDDLRLFAWEGPSPLVPVIGTLEAGALAMGNDGPLGQIAYLDWDPMTNEPLSAVLITGQELPIQQLLDPETCTFLFARDPEAHLPPHEGSLDSLI